MASNSADKNGRDLRAQAKTAANRRNTGTRPLPGQSATALTKQAKAWEAGSIGERRTGRKLDSLRMHGFQVLHDRLAEPGQKWNLDHIVIGSSGVFVVDAKNWRGTVTVHRGQVWRHWYGGPKTGKQSANMDSELTKVRWMAGEASRRLRVEMTPVISLAGAKSRYFEEPTLVAGVMMVSMDQVASWIKGCPRRLERPQVLGIAKAAERVFPPTTPPVREVSEWSQMMRGNN